MYRLWGFLRKNNKIMMDTVAVCEDAGCSDEAKLQECIQKICYEFDVQQARCGFRKMKGSLTGIKELF
jgi:hypothetical protein